MRQFWLELMLSISTSFEGISRDFNTFKSTELDLNGCLDAKFESSLGKSSTLVNGLYGHCAKTWPGKHAMTAKTGIEQRPYRGPGGNVRGFTPKVQEITVKVVVWSWKLCPIPEKKGLWKQRLTLERPFQKSWRQRLSLMCFLAILKIRSWVEAPQLIGQPINQHNSSFLFFVQKGIGRSSYVSSFTQSAQWFALLQIWPSGTTNTQWKIIDIHHLDRNMQELE